MKLSKFDNSGVLSPLTNLMFDGENKIWSSAKHRHRFDHIMMRMYAYELVSPQHAHRKLRGQVCVRVRGSKIKPVTRQQPSQPAKHAQHLVCVCVFVGWSSESNQQSNHSLLRLHIEHCVRAERCVLRVDVDVAAAAARIICIFISACVSEYVAHEIV